MDDLEKLLPCPFCGAHLLPPTPVQYPKLGLARLHPGALDDGTCPIAGWGFYGEQLPAWNTRSGELVPASEPAARDARIRAEALDEAAKVAEIQNIRPSPAWPDDEREGYGNGTLDMRRVIVGAILALKDQTNG